MYFRRQYYFRLFDALNSKSQGHGYKAPISSRNVDMYKNLLMESIEYLKTLKVQTSKDGMKPLLETSARTAIKGLIITISSILSICDEILGNPNECLQ